ncbi:hypothetical protein V8G54_012202 [Vigna mungo]|uniref:C2H2-type domain-containing protein n=1 Tax=Vigna mungo TaxID=3915 RepID=A0AAQ3NQV4_VIGMU
MLTFQGKLVPLVNFFPIRRLALPINRNMDAQAKKKALFRAKLNAQKKEKRIESPLVRLVLVYNIHILLGAGKYMIGTGKCRRGRGIGEKENRTERSGNRTVEAGTERYNEFDQPVCRVCDVVLKSESLWDAHQVSRKHREAINNLKANAAGLTQQNNAKPVSDANIPKAKPEHPLGSQSKLPESSREVSKHQSSSVLPPGFFDDNDSGKKISDHLADSDLGRKPAVSAQNQALNFKKEKGHFHDNSAAESNVSEASTESKQTSVNSTDTEIKQVKGSLPEGFFDNKEADLRARGIKLVKPDVKYRDSFSYMASLKRGCTLESIVQPLIEVQKTSHSALYGCTPHSRGNFCSSLFCGICISLNGLELKMTLNSLKSSLRDEYKEFEKLIQEDLQEVDNRLEEEEIDAAEMIEEAESVEQKIFREKVEMLKKRRLDLKAANAAKRNKSSEVVAKESTHEDSSSDDESEENFAPISDFGHYGQIWAEYGLYGQIWADEAYDQELKFLVPFTDGSELRDLLDSPSKVEILRSKANPCQFFLEIVKHFENYITFAYLIKGTAFGQAL